MAEAIEVVMHPLFLIALASLVTWAACRWWYGTRLRALRCALTGELPNEDAHPNGWESNFAAAAQPAGGAEHTHTLRLSSLGGTPVLPFLDTSPLSHLAMPEPDLFAHLAESGTTGAADRPYLN